MADHTVINTVMFDQIPEAIIETAKINLHIKYDHTSHRSQLITEMTGLPDFKEANSGTPGLYDFNESGTTGALDLKDDFSFIGHLHDYPEWVYATSELMGWSCDIPGDYSTGLPEYDSVYNVVMWSWF